MLLSRPQIASEFDKVTNSPMDSTAYRKDIDGLRAVAVLLVVVAHAGFSSVAGGFIGVDVFFVISGFLISSIIVNQSQNGTFTFKTFYLRRIKRLVPAFLVVSLATSLVAFRLLIPEDFMRFTKMMGLAFLSFGNFYIANTTGGYFDTDTEEVPFIHTWSLSVEEQFYLIWPITLLLLLKAFNKRTWIPILVLSVGGLWLSQWAISHDPIKSYFLMPSRAFELLMGASLAVGIPRLPLLNFRVASLLSAMGLGLIFYAAITLNSNSAFPGFNAFWPCLGTVLLIYGGTQTHFVTKLLSNKPIVFIGLISYSLYLWHWPIFAFLRYVSDDFGLMLSLSGIALSLLLSVLTWKFIETPFRSHISWSPRKTAAILYVAPLVLMISFYQFAEHTEGYPERFGDNRDAVMAMSTGMVDTRPKCVQKKSRAINKKHCRLGDQTKAPNDFLLFGDSHANSLSAFFDVLGQNSGVSGVDHAFLACWPLVGITPIRMVSGQPFLDEECLQNNNEIFSQIAKSPYQYVVLAGYWTMPQIKNDYIFYADANSEPVTDSAVAQRMLELAMQKTIELIISTGATPIIVKDTPTIPRSLLRCSRKNFLGLQDRDCSFPTEDVAEQQAWAEEILDKIAKQYASVIFIDPKDAMCETSSCVTTINNMPLYHDDDHLTALGSEELGKRYLEKFGNPFTKRKNVIGQR